MNKLEKYSIKANKKTLFIIGGSIWAFAGFRVLSLGYEDLFSNSTFPLVYLFGSILVFGLFFKFIFNNMANKHVKRIMLSERVKHCIFSFFDFKGYVIMAFMITGGILIRNSHIVNPVYLGSFYIGLGAALGLGGLVFLYAGLNYQRTLAVNNVREGD